jgi:type II secretory pathway pseudopilin PulG
MTAARDEAGTTLLEVLVGVAILGIAVVAIVSGLGTSILTTDHHAKQARAHTVLVSAAEAVKSEGSNPYQACATTGAYSPSSGVTLPAGWAASNVAVDNVQFWDGSAFTGSCPAPEQKLQLVLITVTSPDGRAVESVSVVKRNPS